MAYSGSILPVASLRVPLIGNTERAVMSTSKCKKNGIMSRIYENLQNNLARYTKLSVDQRRAYQSFCDASVRPAYACFSVSIRKGNVFVRHLYHGYQSRHLMELRLIERVAKKFYPLPDVDFVVDVGDGLQNTDGLPIFIFDTFRPAPQGIPVPDNTFFDWPEAVCPPLKSYEFSHLMSEYQAMHEELERDPVAFISKKQNDLFWRGGRLGLPFRDNQLKKLTSTVFDQAGPVPPLSIVNATYMQWLKLRPDGRQETVGCVSLADHCKHRFLLHIRGDTYSSRLKYLLGCGSVVVMPTQEWEEWWYPAIPLPAEANEENEILLEVRDDISDFSSKFGEIFFNQQTDRVVRMAKRSQEFALDVFSEHNVDCYYAAVLIGAAATWGKIWEEPGKPINEVLRDPYKNF